MAHRAYNKITKYDLPTLSTDEYSLGKKIALFPNPSNNFIQLSGLTKTESYRIYNISGAEIKSGTISNQEKIDISKFSVGLHFLKFENGNTFKFIKE